MKKRTFITTIILLIPGLTVMAEDGEKALSSGQLMDYVAYGAVLVTMAVIAVALLVLLRTIKIVSKAVLGAKVYQELINAETAEKLERKAKKKKEEGSLVHKLMSLKPLSEEHTLIMEHSYDGIHELNNPTPKWFMYLFYGSMVFAAGYLLNYHVFHFGQLQYDEYKTEMAIAEKEKQAFLAKSANRVDENSVKLTTDAAALASGKTTFATNCSPCHGQNAQGVVGPNLTDDYWLHGNKITDVFKTIKYGYPAKGMPTWEKQLSPKQISDVANYIKSLHGTNPAGAKEPQGEKMM